ncbi:MAG: type II toxin-antitoxin system RelE/ParE family toxin [Rhodoferax sp.]|nr:type II toxin-antitoxin system RelE/ParE family toxin [Rhodoferax sp.]
MRFKLRFHALALKEWRALDSSIREPFKKKLLERLENPRVPAAALHGMADCYKIKLHSLGYRLVYRVDEDAIFVTVLATGKRDKNKVYGAAMQRL